MITPQESAPLAIIGEIEEMIDALAEASAYAKWQVIRQDLNGRTTVAIGDEQAKVVAVFDPDRLDSVADLVATLWNHCQTLLPLARLGVQSVINVDTLFPGKGPKAKHLRLVPPS